MAKIKITLDTRANCRDINGKYPLVLRISHKSKTRDIQLNQHLLEEQFNPLTREIKGIQNSVRHTKRIQKIFGEIDLWLEENKSEIKLWGIPKLKDEIERRFFKKQSELNLLQHSAKMFYCFHSEGKYSTASSYEDALKILVKYQMKLARKDDRVTIKTLFIKNQKDAFEVKPEYQPYDMPIKGFNIEFAKDFKAYLSQRMTSTNSVSIHLRSLQSILSDAEKSHVELRGHKPLQGIRKTSTPNKPVVLTMDEIELIRQANYPDGSSKFHVRNYFLFMFNNMGMNFYDVALAKVNQFDGERFNYSRKKTEREGDHFSIKQSQENIAIIDYYAKGKSSTEYLFPLIPEETPEARIFRVKKDKAKWFNNNMRKIAVDLGIEKNITTYAARDTWTNLGLEMGIDIRKISSGLGHSSVEITEKHYSQSIQEKILDEINAQITKSPSPN